MYDGFDDDRLSIPFQLARILFDAECIYETGPDTSLSYHSKIMMLASASHGLFNPSDIQDGLRDDQHLVGFCYRGITYSCMVRPETDWFDTVVIDLINTALHEHGETYQFFELPPVDQCIRLMFVPTGAYHCAVQRGLIPPAEESMVDDEDDEDDV